MLYQLYWLLGLSPVRVNCSPPGDATNNWALIGYDTVFMILPVFGPLGIMLFSNACIVHYIIIGGYPALAFVFISEFSIKYGFQFPHSLTIS